MTVPSENVFGTLNPRSEGDPEILSSLQTHSSFLGTQGPATNGSSMPPARPPNPPEKESSLHLTNSAQRLQWRGCRHCVRNTPKLKYSHFFPLKNGRSKPVSLGSRTSTFLLSQGKTPCPTERHFPQPSCADQSGNMLSLWAIGSCFRRKKKSSPCGPYFFGTCQCVEAVRKRTLSQRSK